MYWNQICINLPCGSTLIFQVDGDHSTEGTLADLENFRKLASCRFKSFLCILCFVIFVSSVTKISLASWPSIFWVPGIGFSWTMLVGIQPTLPGKRLRMLASSPRQNGSYYGSLWISHFCIFPLNIILVISFDTFASLVWSGA